MSYVEKEKKKRKLRDVWHPKRNDLYNRKKIQNQELSSINRKLELLNQDINGTSESARKYAFAKKYKRFSKTTNIIIVVALLVSIVISSFDGIGGYGFVGFLLCLIALPIHNSFTAFVLQDYKNLIKRFESSEINDEINQLEQEKNNILTEIDELDKQIEKVELIIEENNI